MYDNQVVQSIVRVIYPYGKIRRVFRGALRGSKFHVAPSMGFTFAAGFDAMNWLFLSRNIRAGSVVYDVGANRGQMSMFFSRIVGEHGQVYSFEPMLDLLNEANKNIELNVIKNVEFFPVALAEKNGTGVFQYSPEFSTQGKLDGVEENYLVSGTTRVEVQTRTLDSMIEDGLERPDIIKIDVEGAAGKVLEGAGVLLDECNPNIYIELHGPVEQQAVSEHLATRGYIFMNMNREAVPNILDGWHSPLWCSVSKSARNSS
jgi:FkbM family methyltransferase